MDECKPLDEGEGESYRLRLRPHHVVALARALGRRRGAPEPARATPAAAAAAGAGTLSAWEPSLDVSLEVVGNVELEELRDVLLCAAACSDETPAPLRVGGANVRLGGANVRVAALTVSLLFVRSVVVHPNGRAVQVDSIKRRVESAPGVCNQRLKLKCDEPLSNVAFNINVRRYTRVRARRIGASPSTQTCEPRGSSSKSSTCSGPAGCVG